MCTITAYNGSNLAHFLDESSNFSLSHHQSKGCTHPRPPLHYCKIAAWEQENNGINITAPDVTKGQRGKGGK